MTILNKKAPVVIQGLFWFIHNSNLSPYIAVYGTNAVEHQRNPDCYRNYKNCTEVFFCSKQRFTIATVALIQI